MNVYLIGYRGSGKSTVAPLVARALSTGAHVWKTVDTDDIVEADAKQSIADLFAKFGESDFRRRESDVIEQLASQSALIVSLGGGAPLLETNRQLISNSGRVVWLRGQPELLWKRISQDQTTKQRRPNLTKRGGFNEVVQLLSQRSPVYEACADYTIDVDALSPEEIADRIVNQFQTDDK